MATRYEIYKFTYGTQEWFFTSHRKNITQDGTVYKAVRGLRRSNIEDEDIDKSEIEIEFPSPDSLYGFAQIFINKIYFESVHVTITEYYNAESLVLFKGRVTQPQFDDYANVMVLACSTAESFERRNILTRKFQRTCPNKIYDKFCGLVFADWSVAVTITGINGLDVSYSVNPTPVLDEFGNPVLDEFGNPVTEVKTYPQGYFTRGILKKSGVFTFIIESTNIARLYRRHIGLQVGDVVELAPGCNQSLELCDSRFNNHLRFAGYPNMPSDNPVNNQIIK